jgi:hypothetical protein
MRFECIVRCFGKDIQYIFSYSSTYFIGLGCLIANDHAATHGRAAKTDQNGKKQTDLHAKTKVSLESLAG